MVNCSSGLDRALGLAAAEKDEVERERLAQARAVAERLFELLTAARSVRGRGRTRWPSCDGWPTRSASAPPIRRRSTALGRPRRCE